MIELIYNEEEESTSEEMTLPEPKNVKQVGEPGENKKIFIEDYVHTYLLGYSADKEYRIKIAILLGTREKAGGKRNLYIKSALPVEGVTEKQGKYNFTEKVWADVYQQCEKYFPGQEIMGWFLAKPGFPVEKTHVTEETHRTYFSGADKVLFMIEPLEGESSFFGFDGNSFTKQSGYYIYYEKNDPMHEFMMEKNGKQKNSGAAEKTDIAIENFRKILREKQEQNEKRKKLALSYGVKAAALLLVFAGLVTLKKQADRIQTMERQTDTIQEQEPVLETSGEGVFVEELPGNVEEQPKSEDVEEERIPITDQENTEEASKPEPPAEEAEDVPGEPAEEAEAAPEEPSEEAAAEVPVYEEYTIEPGDTLAEISRNIYGSDNMVDEICELNGIENGDYIQVGEIILLP